MSQENEQIESRRERLRELRENGPNPYINRFKPTHNIAEVRGEHGEKTGEQLESEKPSVTMCLSYLGHRLILIPSK